MPWLPLLLLYAALIVVFFAVKLNRGKAVTSSRTRDGNIEAIEFYWRPG